MFLYVDYVICYRCHPYNVFYTMSHFIDANGVRIGKISYDIQQVLGHGSHGTIVFK